MLIGVTSDWYGCWLRCKQTKVLAQIMLTNKILYTLINYKICDTTDMFEAHT